MTSFILFVQTQGRADIVEVQVAEGLTGAELHSALAQAGVATEVDVLLFVDEDEAPIERGDTKPVEGLKHGSHVHVARCRHIKTTVHFLEKTQERSFPPGAHVRAVKHWSVREFHLDHKDAAEHVLQICNSPDRPATNTPLHALTLGNDCAVCFDLVPEKRVEG